MSFLTSLGIFWFIKELKIFSKFLLCTWLNNSIFFHLLKEEMNSYFCLYHIISQCKTRRMRLHYKNIHRMTNDIKLIAIYANLCWVGFMKFGKKMKNIIFLAEKILNLCKKFYWTIWHFCVKINLSFHFHVRCYLFCQIT